MEEPEPPDQPEAHPTVEVLKTALLEAMAAAEAQRAARTSSVASAQGQGVCDDVVAQEARRLVRVRCGARCARWSCAHEVPMRVLHEGAP